ncbi:MAG: three-Cys-motif partner protein TcmP [Phycisphaerae bacterium]|nr:three-Cys-motif partner protein TcmP [Phycisphaerae bacterium]
MSRNQLVDENPGYWGRYAHAQRTKHALLKTYLDGWFAALRTWAGRIAYVDTHAGRGRRRGGEMGSPLVALRTFLGHPLRGAILRRSEMVFHFIEGDKWNVRTLTKEINGLGRLPRRVHVDIRQGDCFGVLRSWVDETRSNGEDRAPTFVFMDPYGYRMPGSLLGKLMELPRVELLVNVMWRELNMAFSRRSCRGMVRVLNSLFRGFPWRKRMISKDFDTRAEQVVDLYRDVAGARWATFVRMRGHTGVARYLLLHLTNHDAARDLMKRCIWQVCPRSGYYVRKPHRSAKYFSFRPKPDLTPVRQWVVERLSSKKARWRDLLEDARREIWRICI